MKAGDNVRFALVTGAQIEISDDGKTATLSGKDKTLKVKLSDSIGGQWKIASAQGPHDYDEENTGMQMLVADFTAPVTGKMSWSVTLVPGSVQVATANLPGAISIKDWPLGTTCN